MKGATVDTENVMAKMPRFLPFRAAKPTSGTG
jgi:hypothetical protein